MKLDFDPNENYSTVLPEDWYQAAVVDEEERESKAGHKYLSLTFKILEGPWRNASVYCGYNINHPNPRPKAIARAQLQALCRAVGISEILTDSSVLVKRVCRIKVVIEKSQDGLYENNRVTAYEEMKVGEAAPQNATVTW